jgi:hypothetical protein
MDNRDREVSERPGLHGGRDDTVDATLNRINNIIYKNIKVIEIGWRSVY